MKKENWEIKKLGEVCEIINGRNQKKVVDPNGIYPIMGSGGIMGYANDFLCPKDTVIIGRKGTINNPFIVNNNVWIVDTAFGFVANESVLKSHFLNYFCKSYDFNKLNVAVTIPSLRKIDLKEIPIPVPPLSVQQSIVAELDSLHRLKELQEQQLAEYDTLAQSTFYSMFGDPIENEKGWEVKKLGEVCEMTSGGTPSSKKKEYYENGSINWLRSGEVNRMFITEAELRITEAGRQNSSAKLFPIDTVLVAMYGATVGQVGILKFETTTNQAICGIFPNEYFNPIMLYFVLKIYKPEFLKLAIGGAQSNISQSVIKKTDVIFPPFSLQTEFAERIEKIEKQKEWVKQSIAQTHLLINYTMDKYFG